MGNRARRHEALESEYHDHCHDLSSGIESDNGLKKKSPSEVIYIFLYSTPLSNDFFIIQP
jgi:hypothetical protein